MIEVFFGRFRIFWVKLFLTFLVLTVNLVDLGLRVPLRHWADSYVTLVTVGWSYTDLK